MGPQVALTLAHPSRPSTLTPTLSQRERGQTAPHLRRAWRRVPSFSFPQRGKGMGDTAT